MSHFSNDSDPALARRRNVREGRIFALTLAAGFAIVGTLALRKDRHAIGFVAFALVATAVLAALLVPGRLELIRRAWMKVGEAIGYVTTPVILAIAYYLFLTPLAIVRRLASRRPMAGDSNWHKRPPLPPAQRLERQF